MAGNKMNVENKKLYEQYITQMKEEGARLPEAAALAMLVEKAILDRSYKEFYSEQEDVQEFDVIVTINIDPRFGIYRYDDDDMIFVSTADGIVGYFL